MPKRRKDHIPSGSDKQVASRVNNTVACRAVSRQRSQRNRSPRQQSARDIRGTVGSAVVRAQGL
jgi:hypothetical protein